MRPRLRRILSLWFSLLAAGLAEARELVIANPDGLAALRDARAGDTVILRNGAWKDAQIEVRHGGEPSRPLLIRAETPGGVILGGSSTLVLAAPYVTVEGLRFQGGALTRGAVIWFKSDHDVVRECAVIDCNPPDYRTAYLWVLFSGSHNQLDHCFFKGKSNRHAVVENGEPACRYNSVTRCHFKDIPLHAHLNGREIVKVLGAGHVDASNPDGAYFTLADNLFDHADGEGVEVVSLKSNGNRVLRNTVLTSIGALNIRRGSDNEIAGNVILGQDRPGAQGIRMSGANNRVHDNLVSGCDYGIAVSSGEYWQEPLTPGYEVNDREGSAPNKARYPQNTGVTISHNVTVGISGADLDIGVREYKKHWPKNQNVLLPEHCRIEANLFIRPAGGTSVIGQIPDPAPPLDRFHFQTNAYLDNVLWGGKNGFAPAAAGCQEAALPDTWPANARLTACQPLTAPDVGPAWLTAKDR